MEGTKAMTIDINMTWKDMEGRNPREIQASMGFFSLFAEGINLTENKNTLDGNIQESALLSAYPLAMWWASSWWRLLFEPLPCQENLPSTSWKMAHELAAANEGFLWPRIILASDGENMHLWAVPSESSEKQSLRYLNGLRRPVIMGLHSFEQRVELFIASVLDRLETRDCKNSNLKGLWGEIMKERNDPEAAQYRRREAELGFDPDECHEKIIERALSLSRALGERTFSEIAPVYGREASRGTAPLEKITALMESPGLDAAPDPGIRSFFGNSADLHPWQRGKEMAREIRRQTGVGNAPLSTSQICDLLGIHTKQLDEWVPSGKQKISLATPGKENYRMSFHLRKKHPLAKRFELARLLGDHLYYQAEEEPCLTCTDLRTSRQKFQRAFAAEFLSPLEGLQEILESDFSESSLEDAAEEYQVSTQTVESMLINNGLMESWHLETPLPYGGSCA